MQVVYRHNEAPEYRYTRDERADLGAAASTAAADIPAIEYAMRHMRALSPDLAAHLNHAAIYAESSDLARAMRSLAERAHEIETAEDAEAFIHDELQEPLDAAQAALEAADEADAGYPWVASIPEWRAPCPVAAALSELRDATAMMVEATRTAAAVSTHVAA